MRENITIWSITLCQTIRTIGIERYRSYDDGIVTQLRLLTNGIHLAAGIRNHDSDINVYNVNTGDLVYFLRGASDCYFEELVQIGNSDLLASSCRNTEEVRVWKTTQPAANKFILRRNGRTFKLFQLSSDILAAISFSQFYQSILLWNLTSTQLIRNFTSQCSKIANSFDFSLDEKQTTFVCSDLQQGNNQIQIWNWTTGNRLNTIQTGSYIGALSVMFLPTTSKKLTVLFLFPCTASF